MTIVDLLILAAATWYVSYVLTSTEGPGGVFLWIRENVWHGRMGMAELEVVGQLTDNPRVVKKPFKNGLLDCIICTAFWIAQLLAFVTGHTFIEGLAIAGVCLWLHSYSGWRFSPPGS